MNIFVSQQLSSYQDKIYDKKCFWDYRCVCDVYEETLETLEFPENEFLLFVSSITFNQLTFIFCFGKYMTWRFDNGK